MRLAIFLLAFLVAGCKYSTPTEPTSTANTPTTTTTSIAGTPPAATVPNGTNHPAEQQMCVDFTNAYRATIGLSPLPRSNALDAFATTAAQADAQSRVAHGHFRATNGGGVSRAENMIPWWPVAVYRTIEQVLRTGIGGMWSEGPGGGHYENMRGRWSEMGCGIFVGNGEVTVAQEFR